MPSQRRTAEVCTIVCIREWQSGVSSLNPQPTKKRKGKARPALTFTTSPRWGRASAAKGHRRCLQGPPAALTAPYRPRLVLGPGGASQALTAPYSEGGGYKTSAGCPAHGHPWAFSRCDGVPKLPVSRTLVVHATPPGGASPCAQTGSHPLCGFAGVCPALLGSGAAVWPAERRSGRPWTLPLATASASL
jgi:hypothetical protein